MNIDHINYNHLYYFWITAREGSISKASRFLRLAQPTISAQLKLLEQNFNAKLYVKDGRTIKLTESGRIALSYADEIFNVGRELKKVLQGGTANKNVKLLVGISDVIPKLIAFELLKISLKPNPNLSLVCYEDRTEKLLSELAIHKLDLVITDTPLSASTKIKGFNHLLGESSLTFFAAPALIKKYQRNFPTNLNGAPFLLPTQGTSIRQNLDIWFDNHKITPKIVGEFDDSALMKVFGQAGLGIFPAHSVIRNDIMKQYKVRALGNLPEIKDRFYAITVERKIKHPAVLAITETARKNVFY